ncbi:MAG: hypothetical protein Q8Q33_07005 [Chlamydiota bacterium]|nr:hypothetical protein [Chlamydiota bacterium]
MKETHEILKEAIDKVGVKEIAHTLHVSNALVYKWCQASPADPNSKEQSGAANPLDRMLTIYKKTQDIDLVQCICQAAGGFFVHNPTCDPAAIDHEVLNNIQKIMAEFSETLDVIIKAYERDHRIDADEASQIRKEWEDLKRVGETFVNACESGIFNRNKNI